MQLSETDFIEYVKARCFKGSKFDDGGFTPVIKEIRSGGFSVTIHDSHIEITLSSARREVRRFGSMDSAAAFLNKCGFLYMQCQMTPKG